LPPAVSQLSSLQWLDLNDNQLASLPPEVGLLSSLQHLDLSGNQLTSLPPDVGHLSSLQELYLGHSQLTSLPPEIGHLSSLRVLWLGNNQLTSLPHGLERLSSLRYLYLGSNQLTSLPLSLFPCGKSPFPCGKSPFPSLQLACLSDNCLITLPFLPSAPSFSIEIGTQRIEIGAQRLPVTLDACSFDDSDINIAVGDNGSPSEEEAAGFDLQFYTTTDEGGGGDSSHRPLPFIHITDRHRLARRWPFFRHLLEADLSEAHSGHADLSPYFSRRLGQCIVDYFEGNPIQVSSLRTQDCHDLVDHADYFGLSTTLLLAFCTTKLQRGEST
ncbi:MAG: leucine-rich repeat domain-containing protein, partial [Candidatus Paceibacterota bacterium]